MGAHEPHRGPQGRDLSRFASVVLVEPSLSHLDRAFTYAVPDAMVLGRGSLVRVPFRGTNRRGVVTGLLDESDVERALPIVSTLGPGLDAVAVDLAGWVADRYLSTLGEALAATLPERVAGEEGEPMATPGGVPARPGSDHPLARALERDPGRRVVWRPAAREPRGPVVAALVGDALARGRGALVLVPEVRVPSAVASAIAEVFGDAVAWLGSDRPARARYRGWLALRAGVKALAAGGRGAVFAPVRDLGLIVLDDEAHASYKEGRAPRFHARAVAAERARRSGAALVLIGTPPSVEARTAAEAAAYTLIAPPRAEERRGRVPVTIVDRSKEQDRLVPSARTLRVAAAALEAGDRAVVLVHRSGDGFATAAERAIRILKARAPAVLDARAPARALLSAAARSDCIVATPVIAKDLELVGVGALAIVEADAALAQPEFRAAEEAFATWWRAARWVSGHIVIETADPSHPAVAALARWDPDVLWRAETARRRELGYPPFAALARIDVPTDRASAVATELAGDTSFEVLGPAMREGRSVIVVRAPRRERLLDALRPIVARWRTDGEPMRVDVDPWEVLVPKWRS